MVDVENLSQKAVKAAIGEEWYKAVGLNQEILKKDPENIAALNRLGKAFLELGKLQKARGALEKVLTLDSVNPIAKKNLLKIKKDGRLIRKVLKEKRQLGKEFLKEPGKSKTIQIKVGNKDFSYLSPGEKLALKKKLGKLTVVTLEGKKLGAFKKEDKDLIIKALKEKINLEITFVSCKKGRVQLLVKVEKPIFKEREKLDYRPYLKYKKLEEPQLELQPLEEESK